MAKNDTNPPVRFQRHGKRVGRATSIPAGVARIAGKGRQRNRVHRGDGHPSGVLAADLVPAWMIATRDGMDEPHPSKFGTLGRALSAAGVKVA